MSDLVGCGISETAAREYVTSVRRAAVGDIEERLYVLEGRVAQNRSGPIRIPAQRSGMRDAWVELTEACGRWIANFTCDGDRLFTRDGSDGLDTYLERYDPGSPNVNAAVQAFAKDLNAVLELRRQRGAVIRDGIPDPQSVASDPYEIAALYGPYEDAVVAVRELEEATILEGHWAELDYLTSVVVTLTEPLESGMVESMTSVEPVGIKEIAERLGVQRATVDQWLQRRLLPEASWVVGGRPAWDWRHVEEWARETGRLDD